MRWWTPPCCWPEALVLLHDELVPTLGVSLIARADGVEAVTRTNAAVAQAARGRAMAGHHLDEKATRRGTLGVTELAAGGLGGMLPSRSAAWLDIRLPPGGLDPGEVLSTARRLLRRLTRQGTAIDLRAVSATPALESTPDLATRRAVEEACLTGFGRSPVYVRSGGTVPAVGMMARAFGVRPLLLGFGSPGGNAHGPDESIDLAGWAAGCETAAALLAEIASASNDRAPKRRQDRLLPAGRSRVARLRACAER